MDRCASVVGGDGVARPLTTEMMNEIEVIKNEWSATGKRVILLACKILPARVIQAQPEDGSFEEEAMAHAREGLTLVGLIAIQDSPRTEIPEVIRKLRRAGIRIFMVTGDFKITAQAIARECGIITSPPSRTYDISTLLRDIKDSTTDEKDSTSSKHEPVAAVTAIVLSGPELIELNEHQWTQLCTYEEIVFARTTPEQKLRIVKEFQARANIVGMTGDGRSETEK